MFSYNLVGGLSAIVGASEPALRLLLTVLSGYPLALLHRQYIYGKPPCVQHLFAIASGFALGYWNYGIDIFHAVGAITLTYTILIVLGGTALSVGLVFTLNMVHLLGGYLYSATENYDINWTMPQCILALRLIAVAFDYYDGQQPPEKLSPDNRKVALTNCPSLMEGFAQGLFPASFIVGPQFPMKRYQDFVEGKFSEQGCKPNSVTPALKRFALGALYLSIFQLLGMLVSDEYLLTEEFSQVGFLKKMLLMGLWGRYTLYKYISCWLLTEGACILFGLAHNGTSPEGETLWNGVENVKLATFENTTEFTHYIQSFNTNTNHWSAQYVYKRLKFLGNRHVSQLATLMFLAVWHGFHSGYYVCFFFEFIVVYMEREVKSIVKNHEGLSVFFAQPMVVLVRNLLLRLYTFVFMGWCLMPFALLQFSRYWQAFGNVYFIGILVFVLWPLGYSPILKVIFKRTRSKDSTD